MCYRLASISVTCRDRWTRVSAVSPRHVRVRDFLKRSCPCPRSCPRSGNFQCPWHVRVRVRDVRSFHVRFRVRDFIKCPYLFSYLNWMAWNWTFLKFNGSSKSQRSWAKLDRHLSQDDSGRSFEFKLSTLKHCVVCSYGVLFIWQLYFDIKDY